MRKLPDHGARGRVLDEKPHEADAVVVLLFTLVRRKEQIARERRHRRDVGIADDDPAALRDLDPFVHVRAGILAADDVFRWRKEPPEAEQDERDGDERGQPGAARGGRSRRRPRDSSAASAATAALPNSSRWNV